MDKFVVIAFVAPAIIVATASFLLGRYRPSTNQRFINTLIIAQAMIYLGCSLWLASSDLPVYLLENGYLFADTLGAYEAVITSVLFLLSAVYARGYVASLLERGEI